ncbi:MAG: DinB family protein, partial [Candidatus Dormibacteraeota bacterium]|nr:DinB family protein [Candidatus Dormibacteraeota bacterium]
MRAVLTTTPERWLRLVELLPEEVLERPPVSDKWSATDCLRHMLASERNT